MTKIYLELAAKSIKTIDESVSPPTTLVEGARTVTSVYYAVVNETCPVCGQGRVLVARKRGGHSFFVVCEDCESEWNEPKDSYDVALVIRNTHPFLSYVEPSEMFDHQWYPFIFNR